MSMLTDLIHQVDTGDPDETAVLVFDELRCPTKWREVFGGLVRSECRRQSRNAVRLAEEAADLPTASQGRTDAQIDGSGGGDRTAYLAERFALGDGRFVTWAEATVDDHLARIDLLDKLRSGIARTIDRHRQAISDIQAAGATCLGDLGIGAAA